MAESDETLPVAPAGAPADPAGFALEELLTCDSCLRANAPTRTQCLYCGAQLGPSGSTSRLPVATAATEPQPSATYIVVRSRAGVSIAPSVVEQLAGRFQFKTAELQGGIDSCGPFPLTKAAREQALELLAEVQAHGVEAFLITASQMETTLPRKIRALQFNETSLTALTASPVQQLRANWGDLALIVSGRLQTNRVEVDERQSRSAIKHLDRRELSQDESVIDLYAKPGLAWRLTAKEFDFSCLGEQKSLTAFDNLRALIDLFRRRSGAELNDAYTRLRPLLNVTWPLEMTSSKGRSQRPRASRKDVSVVTATDNTTQFNNYSRLAWSVRLYELETGKSDG